MNELGEMETCSLDQYSRELPYSFKQTNTTILSKVCSIASETRNQGTAQEICAAELNRTWGKNRNKYCKTFYHVEIAFCLIQHLFGFYKSVIILQSSDKVGPDSFCLFFPCVCGWMEVWTY
jgi:hypothetical protein